MEVTQPFARCECSHDSDSVGDVESVVLWAEDNVSLLLSIGSDESVDLLDFDVVEFLTGLLDLGLGGLEVGQKDEGVVVFNSLDSTFGGEWVLDDGKLVHA